MIDAVFESWRAEGCCLRRVSTGDSPAADPILTGGFTNDPSSLHPTPRVYGLNVLISFFWAITVVTQIFNP